MRWSTWFKDDPNLSTDVLHVLLVIACSTCYGRHQWRDHMSENQRVCGWSPLMLLQNMTKLTMSHIPRQFAES